MNSRQRRIATVDSVEFDRLVAFTFDFRRSFFLSPGRRSSSREHLEFIRWFVKLQREGRAPFVPIPAAKGYEARAASEALRVIVNDVMRVRSGDKPPHNDWPAGFFGIRRCHFENIKARTPVRAAVLYLEGTGNLDDEFQ